MEDQCRKCATSMFKKDQTMNLSVSAAGAYETRKQIAISIFLNIPRLAYSPTNGRDLDVIFNDTTTETPTLAIQRDQGR